MKNIPYACILTAGIFLSAIVTVPLGLWVWMQWQYHLPPEQRVRKQFEDHRTDYLEFVKLLRKDSSAIFIESDGTVEIDGIHGRMVPQYRDLMHKIGAKFAMVREDGSMEFTLWGNGGAIMSDSYMGVRYFPNDHKTNSNVGYTQIVVGSLDSAKLPQDNGSVATGLYVVALEPEWYLYRFEYQE